MAAVGVWLTISTLQTENSRLRMAVAAEQAARQNAERNTKAIGELLVIERARAEQTTIIKETINASPGGSVPADIRAALDGLRNR